MQPLVNYVERVAGDIVTWLHEEDTYFGVMIDSIFGTATTSGSNQKPSFDLTDDDDWFNGPRSKSRQTKKGGGGANNDKKKPRHIGGTYEKLGGLTKLAADIISLPTLREGEAYAGDEVASHPSSKPQQEPRAHAVVSHEDLTSAYVDAISGVVETSAHYASFSSASAKSQAASAAGSSKAPGRTAREAAALNAKPTAQKESGSSLHPALTATATVLAFAVGLFATKVMG